MSHFPSRVSHAISKAKLHVSQSPCIQVPHSNVSSTSKHPEIYITSFLFLRNNCKYDISIQASTNTQYNMHGNFLLINLLTLSTSIFSAPGKRGFQPPTPYNYINADSTSTGLQKRNVGGVRLSDGADFTGNVWYGIMPLADCIALNS